MPACHVLRRITGRLFSDKRRARLNVLSHILSWVPYQGLPRTAGRQDQAAERQESDYPFRVIAAVF